MKKSRPQKSESPSQLIDAKIKELGDWRGKMLGRLRTLYQPTEVVTRARDSQWWRDVILLGD